VIRLDRIRTAHTRRHFKLVGGISMVTRTDRRRHFALESLEGRALLTAGALARIFHSNLRSSYSAMALVVVGYGLTTKPLPPTVRPPQ
jgi:hypothetical protein